MGIGRDSRWLSVAILAVVTACGGGNHASSASVSTTAEAPDGGSLPDGGTSGGSSSGAGPASSGGADGGAPAGSTDGGVAFTPPISRNGWTFYGTEQGLSQDVQDVSADEGGNVYVAGGDAVYAKKGGDQRFLRFDSSSARLTQNCYQTVPPSDPGFAAALNGQNHPTPPGPPIQCPILSVAGGASGTAIIGFQGLGTDDDSDAEWAMDSGGADVVSFDGASLSRARHVFVASPPHTICVTGNNETHATSCANPYNYYWTTGRKKLRQVFRIVINHRQGTPGYGDAWMGGTHATLTALLNNASARGYLDRTAGQPAPWADAKDVWEHDHPAIYDAATNQFLTGYTYAISIDPRSGIPWASNGFRTAWMAGYGADLSSDVWWLEPADAAHPDWIDVWPDGSGGPLGPGQDDTMSLSFCDDGTLWMGSSTHGLAIQDPSGTISYLSIPNPAAHGDSVDAVACDPTDQSIWIGLGWGGVMRYKNGQFTTLDPSGLPAFVNQPVQSIQIDRWSTPRTVYFAFVPSKDSSGKIVASGGVAAYSGP